MDISEIIQDLTGDNRIKSFADDYLTSCQALLKQDLIHEQIIDAVNHIKHCKTSGGKLIFAGNGASASIANHASLDFTKQAKVPSINFNESAFITAFANDYGYENWISKALDFYAEKNDILILISCSGTSKNIVNAAMHAKNMGLSVISFTGFKEDNPTRVNSDVGFWVDSKAYNIIEGIHHIWLLMLCDVVIGKTEYAVS